MEADDPVLVFSGQEPFDRLGLALQLVDPLRLLAVLVDREDEAAVQELLVDDGGRRRQKDHHRPFDAVLLRDEAAGVRVLPRGRDRQLAFRLEELQRVAGSFGSFFFDDGQDLVAQALLLGEIEE